MIHFSGKFMRKKARGRLLRCTQDRRARQLVPFGDHFLSCLSRVFSSPLALARSNPLPLDAQGSAARHLLPNVVVPVYVRGSCSTQTNTKCYIDKITYGNRASPVTTQYDFFLKTRLGSVRALHGLPEKTYHIRKQTLHVILA